MAKILNSVYDLLKGNNSYQVNLDGFTAGKNELFPIPIEEIQFANGNWAQNPGY